MGRLIDIVFISVLLLPILQAHALADSDISREDRIKAAIVYKLTRYVEWPRTSFASSTAPFQLCMWGNGIFAAALYAAEGRRVHDHPLQFRTVDRESLISTHCHALYVPASRAYELDWILSALGDRAVLSMSDIPGFARQGGMVGLVKQMARTGFEINLQQARQAGLGISSQLLALATLVSAHE